PGHGQGEVGPSLLDEEEDGVDVGAEETGREGQEEKEGQGSQSHPGCPGEEPLPEPRFFGDGEAEALPEDQEEEGEEEIPPEVLAEEAGEAHDGPREEVPAAARPFEEEDRGPDRGHGERRLEELVAGDHEEEEDDPHRHEEQRV